jgi:uncharacterized repeat protein (TIGR01451 family)
MRLIACSAIASPWDAARDQIIYTCEVENTGAVTLTDVVLNDALLGAVTLIGLTDEDGDTVADDLAVGATVRGTLMATVSQDEVDSGQDITNIATAESNETAPETATTEETAPETATQAVDVIEDLPCGLTSFVQPGLVDATQLGDASNNSLNGGNGNSEVFGVGGDDRLSGNGGSNGIIGNSGDDILHGGNNADSMFGDNGNDILNGNDGADQLSGGIGDDKLYGAGGDDDILAGDGDDRIFGGAGNDTIQGEGGDDCIAGSEDDGFIVGSVGADRFEFDNGDGIDLLLGFNANEGDVRVISGHTAADAQLISGSNVYGSFAGIAFDNGAGGLEGVFFQQEQNPLALQGFIDNGVIDFV